MEMMKFTKQQRNIKSLKKQTFSNPSLYLAVKRFLFFSILHSLFIPALSSAQTLSFDSVWGDIQKNSPALQAAQLKYEAAQSAQSRSALHWLPQVYVDAKAYKTNEPGASFFGLLQQRSVESTDFNPNTLNHPESGIYTRGALGLNLPLYEGGMRSSFSRAQSAQALAEKYSAQQVQLELYTQAAESYASLSILEKQIKKMEELKKTLGQLLKNYQLGNRSNPVGYSGLLGMRSLMHRLDGVTLQYQAQLQAQKSGLREMGAEKSEWASVTQKTSEFVKKYLSVQHLSSDAAASESSSYKILALKESSLAAAEFAEMEKARYLPRLGAFAEAYLFNGERKTSDGYTAGLYLQWNLFNPQDFGTYKEAQLKSKSVEKQAAALESQSRAQKNALSLTVETYEKNLELLEDSEKLMSEQTQVTAQLFKNGSISALQFVEVLNRRTDLISQQTEAELGLIKTAVENVKVSKMNLN